MTDELISGGLVTELIPPGDSVDLKLVVTANDDRAILPSQEVVITVVPEMHTGISDRVRAVTTVPRSLPGSVLISRGFTGSPANNASGRVSISSKGRFIAFESDADNLVPTDFNDQSDVFRADLQTGQTLRVSESLTGEGGLARSTSPSMSRDGNRVAFHSRSDNIIMNETEFRDHIYLRDYDANTLSRITVVPGETTEANRGSESPVISGNGRFILFESVATNLLPNDTNGVRDLYSYDIDSSVFSLVIQTVSSEISNGDSSNCHISFDGRFIVFSTYATNLVANDNNVFEDVVFLDREQNQFELISKAFDGGSGNGPSFASGVSDDGRYVLYSSYASNIVEVDTNGMLDLFLYDRASDVTIPVNIESPDRTGARGSGSGSISSDGSVIAFSAIAESLDSNYSSELLNVILYTIKTGEMSVLSSTNQGKQADNNSFGGIFNADSRYVGFLTDATDLVGETDIELSQLMLFDRASMQPDLLVAGAASGNIRGDDEFDSNIQTAVQLISTNDTRVFNVFIQNDGTYPDHFIVSMDTSDPAIEFFFNGLDITTSVTNNGWTTDEIAPDDQVQIEMHVTETSTAQIDRIFSLQVRSVADQYKRDVLKLVTESDHDKDRMADTWEVSHWGSTSVASEDTDADSDNVSDYHEFVAGTDPTDSTLNPNLTIEKNSAQSTMTVRWQSRSDRFYRLERAAALNGQFEDILEQKRGSPPEMIYEDIESKSRDKAFYRLQIERP